MKGGLNLELFEQEYRKIEKSLFLVALGYLGNTEDAKDAVQEAALSAYKAFGKLKNKEYFKTWITRIVINKSKDFLKKQRYTETLFDSASLLESVKSEDFEILDAILRMDKKLAPYITLRFYNDMTYEEAAALLKIPVSTVKYRTKAALLELRKILEGDVL